MAVTVTVAGQAQSSSQSSAPGSALSGAIVIASGDPDALAMVAAVTVITTERTTLDAILDPPVVGTKPRLTRSAKIILGAMDTIVALLKVRPDLALSVSPTALAATADRVRASLALSSILNTLMEEVLASNLADLVPGWADMRSVYHTASGEAAKDGVVAEAIEPFEVLFARPKRAESTVMGAALQVLKTRKATNKAAVSTGKLITTQQKANALLPPVIPMPTGDATITQPATTATLRIPSTTLPNAA